MTEEKKFKCPICGCNEHYLVGSVGSSKEERALLEYHLSTGTQTYVEFSLKGSFKPYICKKCGHVELFAEEMLKSIQDDKLNFFKLVNEAKGKIKEKRDNIESLTKEKEKLESRLIELNKFLDSEDITVKQQKEYLEEKKSIEERLDLTVGKSIRLLSRELEPLEKELKDLEERLENVSTLKDEHN